MRETGAILVPTRTIVEDMLAHLDAVPDYAATKLVAIAELHAEATLAPSSSGVTVAMGTDIGLTGSRPAQFLGQNGRRAGSPGRAGHDAAAGDRGRDRHRRRSRSGRRHRAAAGSPRATTPT